MRRHVCGTERQAAWGLQWLVGLRKVAGPYARAPPALDAAAGSGWATASLAKYSFRWAWTPLARRARSTSSSRIATPSSTFMPEACALRRAFPSARLIKS